MIAREIQHALEQALSRQAAVALIGPRQVGKTTLAHIVAASRPSVYLDSENRTDRAKLAEPELFLAQHQDKLVILDEIHRIPELFATMRGIIDKGRREGRRTGRLLVLGSAAIELMRQSETLAGRIAYVDMGPLNVLETGPEQMNRLWLRGGFPDSYLAANDAESLALRGGFYPHLLGTGCADVRSSDSGRDARTVLDDARPLPRQPAQCLETGVRDRSECANGHQLPRPAGGPAAGPAAAAVSPECRQAAGQIAKDLCAGQWPARTRQRTLRAWIMPRSFSALWESALQIAAAAATASPAELVAFVVSAHDREHGGNK